MTYYDRYQYNKNWIWVLGQTQIEAKNYLTSSHFYPDTPEHKLRSQRLEF